MKGKYVNIENINGTSYMVNFNLHIPLKEIEDYMEKWHQDTNRYFCKILTNTPKDEKKR